MLSGFELYSRWVPLTGHNNFYSQAECELLVRMEGIGLINPSQTAALECVASIISLVH